MPWNEPGIIGKMLDGGIEGIIVPMVNSAAECRGRCPRRPLRAGRRPKLRARVVAGMRRGDHYEWSTDGIALIPMIETVEAIANLDEILAVPGIDAIYVGPADLSITLGLPPGNNDGKPPSSTTRWRRSWRPASNAGIVPGIHATAALIERRLEQGFRMITVTSDMLAMRASLSPTWPPPEAPVPRTPSPERCTRRSSPRRSTPPTPNRWAEGSNVLVGGKGHAGRRASAGSRRAALVAG